MRGDKKGSRVSIRFEERESRLLDELQKSSGAGSVSDYIRGLVLEAAVREGRRIDGLDIPAWLNTPDFLALVSGRDPAARQTKIEGEVYEQKKRSRRVS